MPLTIVPREEWQSIPVRPEDNQEMILPVIYVIFQLRTSTEPCYTKEECMKTMQEQQKLSRSALGLHDIIYNFMLGGDGRVYEGRGWTVAPPYMPKWRHLRQGRYLYVGSIGDYKDTHLSEEIWYTAWDFIEYGLKKDYIKYKALFKFDSFTTLESDSEYEADMLSTSSDESGYFCSDYEDESLKTKPTYSYKYK
ncbi:peptidoglycan recognition protein 1-like [Macrosteles quadrilineatus]|uniref:peptidoglycan recognition protein 1-like n=1 Tax=Macrosteles quadrilineatus TaxID=74068 RepID=UPI0023E11747|nr:peptidoglycan recognition protein 1-like [Macrosteles quadrilineatus]XP_054264803.1 peptidoglycan recognition protein 1-like [Macrosteles quadrilineatus]